MLKVSCYVNGKASVHLRSDRNGDQALKEELLNVMNFLFLKWFFIFLLVVFYRHFLTYKIESKEKRDTRFTWNLHEIVEMYKKHNQNTPKKSLNHLTINHSPSTIIRAITNHNSIKRRPDPQQLHIFLLITRILLAIEPRLPLSWPPDLIDILMLFVVNPPQSIDLVLKVSVLVNQLVQIVLVLLLQVVLHVSLVIV